MKRMLDLFCGRLGWSKAFLARGWKVTAIDLIVPQLGDPVIFVQQDVMTLTADFCRDFDFICASSPCEEFSVHGMKHFHPNPKYPENGIRLFNYTREICEASSVPYVMENVRPAQQFVGKAVNHCGPFYLWGTGVPPLLWQGRFNKGTRFMPGNVYSGNGFDKLELESRRQVRTNYQRKVVEKDGSRSAVTARMATIPCELANCVADYAERLLEQTKSTGRVPGRDPIEPRSGDAL